MKRIMYLGKQSSPMDIYKHGYTKILSNSRSSLDLSTTKMLDAHRNLITKKAIMDQGKKASNLFNVEKKTKVIHPEDIPSRNNTKTEQLGTQAGNINEGYTKTRSVSPRESVEIEEIATKGPVWNGLEKILKDSGRSPPLEGSKTYRSTGSMRDLFFCGGNLYTDKNVPMALTSKSIIKVPQLPPKPKEGDGETKLKYMSRIFPEETLKHIGNEFTKIPKIADEFYLPINSSNYTHQISSVNSENNKMLDKLLTLYDRDYLELRRTRLEEQIKAKKTVMLLIDKEQTVVTNKRLLNRQIDEMKIITEPEKNNKSGSLNINDLYKQFHEQINKLTHSNQREQFELYVKLYHIRNQDVRLAKDIFEKNINKDTEDKLDAHSIPNIQYKIANFINQMNRKNMQSVDEFFENEAFDPPKDKNANLLNRLQTDSNSSTTSSLQRKYFNLIKAGHLDEVKKLLKKYPYLLTSTDNVLDYIYIYI